MANYLVTDTDLTSVANAIRTKGGTSASLTFPSGFVSAVQNIPSGGGGVTTRTVTIPSTPAYVYYIDGNMTAQTETTTPATLTCAVGTLCIVANTNGAAMTYEPGASPTGVTQIARIYASRNTYGYIYTVDS